MAPNEFVWTADTEIIDLSHSLDEHISLYPADPCFQCHQVATVKDDGCSVTALSLGSHTGTHLDAPSHFVEGGTTVDEIDLSLLQGFAAIIDMSGSKRDQRLTKHDLEGCIKEQFNNSKGLEGFRIVLIRTSWSRYWGEDCYQHHPFFDESVAQYLINAGVKVVGFDTLNPDATIHEEGEESFRFRFHHRFLGSGGIIVENLTNLEAMTEKAIFVSLLPLRLKGVDGSPIRAIGWQQKENK